MEGHYTKNKDYDMMKSAGFPVTSLPFQQIHPHCSEVTNKQVVIRFFSGLWIITIDRWAGKEPVVVCPLTI